MARKTFPWPIEWMIRTYTGGSTIQEIADLLSGNCWQPYWLEHLGEEYRPGQKIVNKVLKKSGCPMRSRGAPLERNGNWNGGVRYDKGGYVLRRCPGHPHATKAGYVREHRLIMEEKLGRYLKPTEVVHHIDDDPTNNAPENLMVFENNAVHISVTMKGKVPSSRIEAAHRAWRRNMLLGSKKGRRLTDDDLESRQTSLRSTA